LETVADDDHVKRLQDGVQAWNAWRQERPEISPDLSYAELPGADLASIDFSGVDLTAANLQSANLSRADLRFAQLFETELHMAGLYETNLRQASLRRAKLEWANLTGADLTSADLHRADLTRADLTGAILVGADLTESTFDRADLTDADLTGADLTWAALIRANLVGAVLQGAVLSETLVYGVAAWDIKGTPARQRALVISKTAMHELTVDDIEVAQFIYLMINNAKVRSVIDVVTSKLVLILGRFSDARKPVLDRLREELRNRDFVPVLFDFAKPDNKDLTGTVETLARMARFVVVDLTAASSVPHELGVTVPQLRTTPIVPLRLVGDSGYSMSRDFEAYPWVLPDVMYETPEHLIRILDAELIAPAEAKRATLLSRL
jgi:uncharacterized protein YjbI with pentapeptide repeats